MVVDSVVENLERCSNFLRTEFLKHFIGLAAGRGLRGGNAARPQNRRNFKNVRGFFGDGVFCRAPRTGRAAVVAILRLR